MSDTTATTKIGFDAETIAPTQSMSEQMADRPASPGEALLAKLLGK